LGATSAASLVISGTKPVGSGVWLNGVQAVAASDATTWSYIAALALGTNNFELIAQDANGQASEGLDISVTRNINTDADVIAQEQKLAGTIDPKLAAKLAGRLLLQVETNGYIWYVSPLNDKRYYISQDSALSIFRSLALGISEANLNLIPTKESGQAGNAALRNRLKGRLLLRVGNQGQISYVDLDGYRHDISAANLMAIFRSLSLGISNANLRKISIGTVSGQ
jgi:hypothetical protein